MLIIDPDMVLRDSMAAWGWQYGAAPGWAVSVFFGYMVGTHNNLSETHIPEIPRRNDTIAGEPPAVVVGGPLEVTPLRGSS